MKKDIIETEIVVRENKIRVMRVGNTDYISLTDLSRYANPNEPKIPIYAWMRNKDVLAYLGLWENLNNNNFKGHEFETFMNEAGKNSFYMSPQKWIKETNAIGMISKSGNNGGTYACSDIALEFASWLSPEFKLYVIQEFQHLKRFAYANEADALNVALFGMTAKEWREDNPSLACKGNIRDYTDLLHLVILSNLESINAEFIASNIPQSERLVKLNEIARKQMNILVNNKGIKDLELLEEK